MTRPSLPVAGVIGWPVSHSKSPLIHRFWLAALGLDGDYVRLPVVPGDVGAAIHALPALGFRGVNVTVPHKQAVIAHLNRVEASAAAVGAVNLVVVESDRTLSGANTDVNGVLESLDGVALDGAHAAIVGAGGAARAVLQALRSRGVARVTILNRDAERAAALLSEFGIAGTALALDAPLPPADLLVNASALGMVDHPPLLLDLLPLPAHATVFDAVYAPLDTDLLVAARARGLTTIDGLSMLIGQARAAFARFYGADAPCDRDAELRALLTA